MKRNENAKVTVGEMEIKFFWEDGCPKMEVKKGNVTETCSGMDFGADEIDDGEVIIVYSEDPDGFEELEDKYFTEEDNRMIAETIEKVFYGDDAK